MSYFPSGQIVRHLEAASSGLSPLTLWKGDGNFNDSVGSRTLSVQTGTERYTMITPFVKGWHFDGSTVHRYNVIDQALILDGAYSIEAIMFIANTSAQVFFVMSSSGESLGTNYMFQPNIGSNGLYGDFWENGAGSNVTTTSNAGLPIGRPFHFAVTRSTPSVGLVNLKVYVDGVLLSTNSGIAAPAKDPTPANNTQLWQMGGDGGVNVRGAIGSVKLFNTELNAAQVLAESNFIRGR